MAEDRILELIQKGKVQTVYPTLKELDLPAESSFKLEELRKQKLNSYSIIELL